MQKILEPIRACRSFVIKVEFMYLLQSEMSWRFSNGTCKISAEILKLILKHNRLAVGGTVLVWLIQKT
jgi:hypothetical protein